MIEMQYCVNIKYTVDTLYGKHFAGKMWAGKETLMTNTKVLALQSSPSHKSVTCLGTQRNKK